MSYLTISPDGSQVDLNRLFMACTIGTIDLSNRPVYCTGFKPTGYKLKGRFGVNMSGLLHLAQVKCTIARFDYISPNTLEPIFLDEEIVLAEVHGLDSLNEVDPDLGADSPKSYLELKFLNSNSSSSYLTFNSIMKGQLEAFQFEDYFTVTLNSFTLTAANAKKKIEPTESCEPISIDYECLSLNPQLNFDNTERVKGTAMLKVRKDKIDISLISKTKNFIEVSDPKGRKFELEIWNERGIVEQKNHFYDIYLKVRL